MNKYFIGIIGLGVGEAHLKKYLHMKNCKVLLIFDKNKKKLLKLSKKYNVYFCNNENEILLNKRINLVSITSHDNYHYEQAKKAIQNNKHVFIEKPAFLNFGQCQKIEKLLKKKKIGISSNLILRCSPRFKSLKKRIQNNFFGKLYYIEGDYNYGRLEKITDGWRSKIKNYSVTLGGGIHLIDLFLFLTNQKVREVSALGNKIVTKNSKMKFKDFVTSNLIFEDGMIGKVTSNFGCVYPHFHKLNIYGTKKTFENHFSCEKIFSERDKITYKKIKSKYLTGKGEMIEEFIKKLKSNKERKLMAQNMFNTLSICYAVEESIELNKKIKVRYL